MNSSSHSERFLDLANSWLDDQITDTEIGELNEILKADAASRRAFAKMVNLQLMLRDPSLIDPEEIEKPTTQFSNRRKHVGLPFLRASGLLLLIMLLAIIALPVGIRVFRRSTEPSVNNSVAEDSPWRSAVPSDHPARALILPGKPLGQAVPLAVVEQASDELVSQFPIGTGFLADDRIQFEDGQIRLHFVSGAIVELKGPADLEFVSSLLARLHRGHATTSVSEEAIGFTIATRHADIVDLGTRFGVSVDESGEAAVVVFEGSVDLDYRRAIDETRGPFLRQNLVVGEAVRIAGYGIFHRVPVVQAGAAPTEWTTKITAANSGLIESLCDNFRENDRPIYYGFVPGGFVEDASAYVDRSYEWNSLPGEPFPEVLRGADYLRFMNDLKFVLNLQIKLTLSRPASVYVLFDARIPAPVWLKESFTKTGLKIGMDESDAQPYFTRRSQSNLTLGIGPGESVDTTFDVWVRDLPEAGEVVFGSTAEQSPGAPPISTLAQSMYGVVVTPLEKDLDRSSRSDN